MSNFFIIHNIKEANGKTIKENNLAKQHKIPLGTLIEIIPWDKESIEDYKGVRLHIAKHTRDCDGTPLYSLTIKKNTKDGFLMKHGFSEDVLRTL